MPSALSFTVPVRPRLPVMDEPAIRRARRDLRRGRWRAARAALLSRRATAEGEVGAALDLLIARADAALGWFEEASSALEGAAVDFPDLSDFLLAERATLADARGDAPAADALIAGLVADAPRFVDLNIEVARRARAEDRPADTAAALERARPHVYWAWKRSRVALWLAQARLALDGDRPAYHRALAALWGEWPRTDAAREAQPVLLAALAEPTAPPPLSLEVLVSVGAERARRGRAGRGRPLARAARARYGLAARGFASLLGLERQPRAWGRRTLREADEALALSTAPSIRGRLLLRKARALRGLGRVAESITEYRRLGDALSLPAQRAEALLTAGALAAKVGRFDEAWRAYDRLMARPRDAATVPPAARARALWSMAWGAWRAQAFVEAETLFGLLADRHPAELDTSKRSYYERALYWQARAIAKQGRVQGARAQWAFVSRRFPLSYYGLLSWHWLRRTGEAPPLAWRRPGAADGAPAPHERAPVQAEARTAIALHRVGLDREARAWLRRLYDLGRLDVSGAHLLSALYAQRGDAWRSHWIVKAVDPLDVPPDTPAHRARWLAAYPRPFASVVLDRAAVHGVDPLLVWAVMRQESAFRVRARSVAHALGLMQVLYPTAQLVARKLKQRAPSLEYVLSARGNVHFGTAYLRLLLAHFHGNLALAIAGYNAGPGGPDRWLERAATLETDEFVEEIPYDETRGYTRKVLASYAAYRVLYGPPGEDPWALPSLLPDAERAVAVAR